MRRTTGRAFLQLEAARPEGRAAARRRVPPEHLGKSAWKLARQYYLARGEKQIKAAVTSEPELGHDALVMARQTPRRYKAIARHVAYHGTTLGALALNGIPAIRMPFEPLVPEVRHVRNTNRYHRPPVGESEAEFTAFLLEDLEQAILSMGPETVCLVHMEPVQNAGGCFTPPEGYWRGVREPEFRS